MYVMGGVWFRCVCCHVKQQLKAQGFYPRAEVMFVFVICITMDCTMCCGDKHYPGSLHTTHVCAMNHVQVISQLKISTANLYSLI